MALYSWLAVAVGVMSREYETVPYDCGSIYRLQPSWHRVTLLVPETKLLAAYRHHSLRGILVFGSIDCIL